MRKLLKEELKEELEPQKQRLEQLEIALNNGSNFTMRPPPNQGFVPPDQPFQWRNQWNRNGNNGRFRNQRQNVPRQSQLCFECGQPGHFARVCPSKQREQPFVAEGLNDQEPSTLRHVMGSNNAYLALKVNGKSTFALLDTGSELTLAPASLVKREDIRSSSQTLRAANGTAIRVLGEASLNCEIDGYSFEVSCLITEQISELILGLEWLENQNALWNFGERWVKIQNHTFPIRTRKRQGNCRRIVVAQDVRVPPLSELDINTYAVVSHLRSTDGQWATQPQVLSSGLVISGTLLPERIVDLPVRVMNPTSKEIRLKKGVQCMAEEVTVVDETTEVAAACANVVEGQGKPTQEEINSVLSPLWSDIADDVPEGVQDKLREIILTNQKAFSLNEWDLGFTDVIQHEIETGHEAPVRQALRRQPLSLLPVIDEQVESMLHQRIIEPSSSAWASNVVMVRKNDGTPRFCVDYRAVNNKTRKDAYPLPLISESLDSLAGAKWFSTFDLRAGYHQLAVHPRDRHKTAFVTRRGLFQFRVLPFGLCNSPASFSRMMNLVMAGLNFAVCLIYLDDIIVFASDLDTHLQRLSQVLERLAVVGLKLKPSKCHLLQRQVIFLGHVVSEKGITTDPGKIQAVRDWPTPRKLRDVRSFVGLCSYYRKFVPDFAQVARPLHALTKKGCQFAWSEECDLAFAELKRRLTESPILALPSDSGLYILDTDASGESIGAVLSQVEGDMERVICYGSRLCSPSERNYDVTRRELLAIVYFLKVFRQYLLGNKFLLRTDHSALQWLRRTPLPIGQQARWLSVIEEFQFDIQHRSGTAHRNADAMSRRPHEIDTVRESYNVRLTSIDLPSDWSRQTIEKEQREDPDLGWIIKKKA